MQTAAKFVSLASLGLTIVPSLFYFAGVLDHAVVNGTALVGSLLWFAATPLWMGQDLPIDAAEVEI